MLESRIPAGDFVVEDGEGPIVLVSAGVGITPVLSMLHQLVAEENGRDIWFVHGARDGLHAPFREELARLTDGRTNIQTHTVFSRPASQDKKGRDYQEEGRVSGALLSRLVPDKKAAFYLCGPAGFLAELKADLSARGVAENRIHFETF